MSLAVFSHEPGRRLPSQRACPDPERKRRLNQRVQENVVRGGARVQSHGEFEAVMVTGKRPNHVLHLLLTLVTLGAWVLVWIGVAAMGGEKRALLTVDESGNVNLTPLRS